MKIGILIDRLNVGGVEKIALEQVNALRRLGVDAELVVLRKEAVVEGAFLDLRKGLPVTYLDQRLPGIFRLSLRVPFFHFFSTFHLTYPILLPFVVKAKEYDYFISHGTYTTLSAITIKWFRKINFSAFIWDPATYIVDRVYKKSMPSLIFALIRFLTMRLDRIIINNTDRVLVGGSAHNSFIKTIDPNKKIEIIYPSVHPIAKLRKKEDYILLATAWKRGKNPEYVIEVAKRLPDAHIRMVGMWLDVEYRREFEKLLVQHNVHNIIVVGEVSEAELADQYSRALFVLQTNDDRGFGMPALEAAGKGSTFIVPKGQGVCRLFDDQVDGFYTKEHDTEYIVKIAKKLLADKTIPTNMGKNAWNRVLKGYSWKKHAELLQDIITEETRSVSEISRR